MKKNYSKWVPDNVQKCLILYENYPKISDSMYKKGEISKKCIQNTCYMHLKISHINVHVHCVPIVQQISDYRYFRKCKTVKYSLNELYTKILLIWGFVETRLSVRIIAVHIPIVIKWHSEKC